MGLKFCFVAFEHPGHVDYGGLGFLRTAANLRQAGHNVDWVFGISECGEHGHRLETLFHACGIQYDPIQRLHLTLDHHHEDPWQAALELSRVLKSRRFDCVVVDRLCIGGAAAAVLAALPWACIGTDGRHWKRRPTSQGADRALRPVDGLPSGCDQRENYAQALCNGKHGLWAASPFLNISFFPREIYNLTGVDKLPRQSHFLGSGATRPHQRAGNEVLVTSGNSFDPVAWRTLTRTLIPILQQREIPVRFLAGTTEAARQLFCETRDLKRVSVSEWMSYDEAYGTAKLVVGHGGTANTWHALRAGIPLLAVPSKGDQRFLAERIEQLGVGRIVVPESKRGAWWRPLGMMLSKVGRGAKGASVQFNTEALALGLSALLDKPPPRYHRHRLANVMASGGGFDAATSLLERLAIHRAPVFQCEREKCCC